jgi:3-methyladenine DNA glycosylase AlkD
MIEEQLFPLIQEKFLTDDKFRAWHLNVLNVLPTTRVLGLRVGDMRKVAKDLVKEDNPLAYVSRFAQTFAKDRNALCYEEVMIWGMMINAVKCTDEERIQLLEDFVPAIDNWAVCDTYCSDAKWMKKLPKDKLWRLLEPYFDSVREFDVRFAVVIAMWYLLEEKDLEKIFAHLEQINFSAIQSEYNMPLSAYYAKMSVAWLLATALAKHPEQTREFVRKNTLPEDIIRLYVRKARESFRTRKMVAY